jgi:DNA invertase Pin-like site-specific DNA recombinase
MLTSLSRKDFDVVAALSVDRLGRSLIDLVGPLQELHSMGVDLHQQGINITTPACMALFWMMSVFAEFGRGMIQERVMSDLASTKRLWAESENSGRKAWE